MQQGLVYCLQSHCIRSICLNLVCTVKSHCMLQLPMWQDTCELSDCYSMNSRCSICWCSISKCLLLHNLKQLLQLVHSLLTKCKRCQLGSLADVIWCICRITIIFIWLDMVDARKRDPLQSDTYHRSWPEPWQEPSQQEREQKRKQRCRMEEKKTLLHKWRSDVLFWQNRTFKPTTEWAMRSSWERKQTACLATIHHADRHVRPQVGIEQQPEVAPLPHH